MALDLFNPVRPPTTAGTSVKIDLKQKIVRFANGYEQRIPDGLNYRRRSGNWTWRYLYPEDASAIAEFLSDHAVSGFRYQLPGDSNERQWRLDGSINLTYPDGILVDVAATIVEIFS